MAKNTIKLKKYSDVIEEFVANAAITPGHLVELMSTGKVKKHATAGGNVAPIMFALEDSMQGYGIDDDYDALDPAQIWLPHPGDEVYAILADDNDVAIGDLLESAGDGTLRKHGVDSTGAYYLRAIVAVAIEAVDTTGSPAATTSRIKVKII